MSVVFAGRSFLEYPGDHQDQHDPEQDAENRPNYNPAFHLQAPFAALLIESDKFLALLIPEFQANSGKTLPESEGRLVG